MSPLYRGDHEMRCELISNLIVMISDFEPGSHQHDVIFRNLLELHPRILDAVRTECMHRIRRIQLDWPICYSRGVASMLPAHVAVKLRDHELAIMAIGERMRPCEAKKIMLLSPAGIVDAFDRAGMITMN